MYSKVTREFPEQYLTRNQVGEILQVSRQTLSSWHDKGVLKGARIGTRIRYRLSDIQSMINSKIED